MEPSQFDTLTKALARSTTRRQALKTVAVMALGGLGLGGLTQVFAKKPQQEHCQTKGQHCNPRRGVRCCEDLVCSHPTGGICIPSNPCPHGQRNCEGNCVDTNTDPTNCGGCGDVCASGETCVQGDCTCGTAGNCPAGQTCCSGMCVNVQTDPNNCGACGHACRSDQVCLNGTCVCPSGQTDCNGTCVNTNTDPNNCGACNNSCNGTTPGKCQNGACVCFGLEHPCTSPSQCCDTGQMVTTCGSGMICCNNAGGQCIDDPDCCGSLHCTLGFCA